MMKNRIGAVVVLLAMVACAGGTETGEEKEAIVTYTWLFTQRDSNPVSCAGKAALCAAGCQAPVGTPKCTWPSIWSGPFCPQACTGISTPYCVYSRGSDNLIYCKDSLGCSATGPNDHSAGATGCVTN